MAEKFIKLNASGELIAEDPDTGSSEPISFDELDINIASVNTTLSTAELTDSSSNLAFLSVAASGSVSLSSGQAVVSTGLGTAGATFYLALGIDDPNADTDISGRLRWNDTAGEYEVVIVEVDTSVNPTVNYDILRVK
jgi:hypothetical protein